MKISLLKKFQLWIIRQVVGWQNFTLNISKRILFCKLKRAPQNILIYKIGNIGDIVCAVPSFIAIHRAYPEAKITLLTSPGQKGAIGAKELLTGAWYLNKLKVYYAEDIDSWRKKINFIRDFKKEHYDLFIQIPDDLADFQTLLRNIIFAKCLGVKAAFGFKIRTIQLFKKSQVDYTFQKTEVESLIDLLRENGITAQKVEFDFHISEVQKNKVKKLIDNIRTSDVQNKNLIVAINPGGKRETNQWPIERFAKVAKYLQDKYNAKIIVVGGKDDIPKAEIIKTNLREENILIAAGSLEILETLELLKYCSFLISNSTGTMHLAAAAGIPVVGLFTVRDVFGRWFPYGKEHKILYHKFIKYNYKKENCIKKSIEMIAVEEVVNACDELIKQITENRK
jgi:heptosyltransferase-2